MSQITNSHVEKLRGLGLNIIPARGKYPDETHLPINEQTGKPGWKIFQTEKYEGPFPNTNYAVICGKTSGDLVVLDLDTVELYTHFKHYNTLTVKTARGYHLYFRYIGAVPKTIKVDHPQFGQHIDIKSDGSYVISPFSKHESGVIYEIIKDVPILKLNFEEVMKKVISLGFVPASKRIKDIVDDGVSEGDRDNSLFKLAMGARHMWGFNETMILACLREFNKNKCDPPLPEFQLEKIAESAITYDIDEVKYQKILNEYEGIKSLVYGKNSFWKEVTAYRRSVHPEELFIYCQECKMEIKDDPFDITHYGHKVKLK